MARRTCQTPRMPVCWDAVVLVGHGAVAADCPRDLVARLKQLEGRRHADGGAPSDEERALDARIRAWPRTPATDPYGAGLAAIADRLRAAVAPARVIVAFNEFCAPTIADAVTAAIAGGARRIAVLSSMPTPGGVHAEVEIPAELARLRALHPGVELHYAWPFDLDAVARLLATQLG
jgi:sirohydrochlorin ferrochelatase